MFRESVDGGNVVGIPGHLSILEILSGAARFPPPTIGVVFVLVLL